jgi:hypothetical protein
MTNSHIVEVEYEKDKPRDRARAASIVLGSGERKRLLNIYSGKEEHPAEVRLRAHVI